MAYKFRRLLRFLPLALLGCVLLLLALYGARYFESSLTDIQVTTHAGHTISLWKNEDGVYYLFLPTNADPDSTTFQVDTTAAVTLDGTPLVTGRTLSGLVSGETYPLTVGRKTYRLQILQSANVATMYIDTQSGTMKAIHADKANLETASLALYLSDGTLDHASVDSCTIRGRGNSTWVYEKRPYLLNFTEPTDLMGMGAANRWVLLANATDHSNLRNYLAYWLAGQMDFTWSPQCEFVDLYCNGEYRGLYLLAERVEVGTSRLDIGADVDSFLCKLDLNERFNQLENPFLTDFGRAVEINTPETLTDSRKSGIAQQVQRLEDAILGHDVESVLDIDSFARRLLLDEVLENLDADRASSYFYYYGGTFYAGPIWDYDHILGSRDINLNPEALLSSSAYKAPDKPTPYQNALYENPVVYQRIIELYKTELRPLLQDLSAHWLWDTDQQISIAGTMNHARWHHMYTHWQWYETTEADLADFLDKRIAFLDSAWVDGEAYCSVQVDLGGKLNYLNFAVKPGDCFTSLSQINVPTEENPVWINRATGEVYTPDQPITQDTQLVLLSDRADPQHIEKRQTRLTIAYSALIALGLAAVIVIDRSRCKPKRRFGI